MERCMRKVKNALVAQDPPLKVAQTRLMKRLRRPEVENCADEAHNKLTTQVVDIQQSIRLLESKLQETIVVKDDLLKNKARLEQDIKVKNNSLLIDQQWCQSKRRTFPFLVAIIKSNDPL